jgi:hypothetical protein
MEGVQGMSLAKKFIKNTRLTHFSILEAMRNYDNIAKPLGCNNGANSLVSPMISI